MRLRVIINLLFLSVCCIGGTKLMSCKPDPDPTNEVLSEIRATYSNPGTPTLKITTSSSYVDLIDNPTSSGSCVGNTNRVCLTINNVRFTKDNSAFDLLNAETFELNGGEFILDVENKLETTKTRTLDLVLVLDLSSSLGTDQSKVKQYAADFIDRVSENTTNSRIGIVVFSDKVESLSLTSNFSEAKLFFQNKNGADETRLFEAIDGGLKLLENSTADGIAIITFTDGINNSWSDPIKYQNVSYVVQRLNEPINGLKVSSFAIGLAGKTPSGALTSQLNQLAKNGGFSEVSENSEVLEKTFKKFANSVSAVYSLTYNRNSSLTSSPISLRFDLTLVPLE